MSVEMGTPVVKEYVERPAYEGSYDVTPTEAVQILETENLRMTDDVTIEAIPADYIGSEIPRKSSADLTASGATVTAPAGYYAEAASKAVQSGRARMPRVDMAAKVTVGIDENGLVTAEASGTRTVSPTVNEGYVTSGESNTITVTGSKDLQLATEAGKTITPSETAQLAVAEHKYTLGDIAVGAIPSDYVGSSVPRKSASDLTASGATVTAPAGYYASSASKSVQSGSVAVPDTSITANPSITVSTGGLITASVSASKSVAPSVSEGYVSSGAAGNFSVSGSKTEQLPVKTSADLTQSGATITAPAGFYAADASATVPNATWKASSTVGVVPQISVDSAGLITADASGWTSITPLTASGYADAATSANIQLAGVRTSQLPTLGATTYTPNKTAPQIITAGQYLTGDQTLGMIPEQYYDMSGQFSWMGKDAELIIADLYYNDYTLADTAFSGWTPSTTAKTCAASVTLSNNKFTASNMDEYEYYIVWDSGVDVVYTGSPTGKAQVVFERALQIQQLFRRPGSWTTIESETFNSNVNASLYTGSFMRYYSSSGSITYTFAATYGFYHTLTAPTLSSTTADSPTITPKTPTLNARCSTSYLSTGNCALIDAANSHCWISAKVYRVKSNGILRGVYGMVIDAINQTPPYLNS